MQQRRRVKHRLSFNERLIMWADEVREQAAKLPPGPDRDALLKKARQADSSSHGRLGQLTRTSAKVSMPFKVKMGSLIIVANSAADVLKIIAASTFAKNEIAVTDLDGQPIDPDKFKDEPKPAQSNAN